MTEIKNILNNEENFNLENRIIKLNKAIILFNENEDKIKSNLKEYEKIVDLIDEYFRNIIFFDKDFCKDRIENNDFTLNNLKEIFKNLNDNEYLRESILDDVIYEIGVWEDEINDYVEELQEIMIEIRDNNLEIRDNNLEIER